MQAARGRWACHKCVITSFAIRNLRRSTASVPMSEVVNLKRYKKQIARDEAAKDAQEKRAHFGRTKVQRQQDQQQKRMLNTTLDGHRLGEDEK
jgi:hypothetical protein